MKIIKHGTAKNKKYRAYCPGCDCIVELSHSEYLGRLLPDFKTGSLEIIGHTFWLPCPECGTLMKCPSIAYGVASVKLKPPRNLH